MHSPCSPLDRGPWQNPPVEYRPVPFWVWNERQDPDELRRQIREIHAQGFGGFFIHARLGLKTPYLGDEWFAHVRLCVDEAHRLGLKAWIYDEDRWPSGFAGGQIGQVAGPDYASYALSCREQDGKREFEVVRAPSSQDLNGASVPDPLSPKVTQAFIDLTHARYEKAVGDHFRTTVPGTFMDEPSYVMWSHPARFQFVPWAGDIEAVFAQRRGYALRPHLACLFFDEGDFRRVRVDFYRTVTERFIEGFMRPIFDWCEARGLLTTGHMMMEDDLLSQVRAIGAAMPHYEHLHQPGIDHLGCGLPRDPLLPKQCTSVARQLGRRRVLSELFGGAGWETPIGDLRPAGDWDFAMGVNVLNQHLAYYSIRGCRKRDYPASCSYHTPGYPLYKPFNEYFSRLSYALSQGEPVCRVLVLHPIASAWALYSPRDPGPVQDLDRRFRDLTVVLLETQRDFDFGDEMLLEKHARIEAGEFVVGRMRYSAIVVPSAETWSSNTVRLLREFAEQGGRIVVVEPVARFAAGSVSAEMAAIFADPRVVRIPQVSVTALDRALAPVPRDIRVRTPAGRPVRDLVYQHRRCGEQDLYFLTFGRARKPFDASVSIEGEGAVCLWDAETGTVTAVPSCSEAGRTVFALSIPAGGARLLTLDRSQAPQAVPRFSAAPSESQVLSGPWSVRRLDPNALVLDRVRVKFGDSPWSEPMSIAGAGPGPIALPNAHDLIEMAYDTKNIWPQWPVLLQFAFRAVLTAGERLPAWFVVENPDAMTEIRVNGQAVAETGDGWWLDRQFRRYDVTGLVRPGLNTVRCRVNWVKPTVPGTRQFVPAGTELDNCYLVGDFDVVWRGGQRTSIRSSTSLPGDPATDLARNGLPFYAGVVRYEATFGVPELPPGRRCLLRFPRPHGEGVRVSVNGQTVRDLWCEPFEADCTAYLQPGENRVRADLFTNLGNVLGPLHHRRPWGDAGHACARYLLRPVGLGGTPVLVIGG